MSIFTQVGPLQAQEALVDREGRLSPRFLRYLQSIVGNGDYTIGYAQTISASVADKADKDTQVIAGGGLTGGGTLAADLTLNVGAGVGITVNADDIAIDTTAEAERIRDVIGTALVAGTGMTVTISDAGDTITLESASSGGVLPIVDGSIPAVFVQNPDGSLVYGAI